MPRIIIYDTTLRDGAQAEGISFSLEDKQEMISLLDGFGVDFIEGGMPSSNPKDREMFSSPVELKKSSLVAFGSTCRPDVDAPEDEGLKVLSECSAEWVCIFGKSWDFQVTCALETELEENIRMVKDSISFLKGKGKRVIFDAEHFFDGYGGNSTYAMDVITAAHDAGAEWIVLCDTNGGSLPGYIGKVTAEVCRSFDKVGIHCHNDSELAVACTLTAVENGATMVQGTINGIGERCGNANLCSVIPDLKMKMGMDIPVDLTKLTAVSRAASELSNMANVANMPFVGEMAFAHKGGMHVSALMKDTRTYEHIVPESVGNRRKVLISDMSGRASISNKVKEMGIKVDDDDLKRISEHVKEMESHGYQYEGADASFRLLVYRAIGSESKPFSIQGFRLHMEGVGMTGLNSEASMKIADIAGEIEHTAADSEGPVGALDKAFKKALMRFYPEIENIRLTDYKVRVLDEKSGTDAWVRVLIRSTDGKRSWNTVGVSENVIEASLIALSDSYEYALITKK